MKNLFIVLSVFLFSSIGHALDKRMTFRLMSYGPNKYEISSSWNPQTQTALVRMGLIPVSVDSGLQDKVVPFSSAQSVTFTLLDMPEVSMECGQVSSWHFEYSPDLPNLLMYISLKGPGCQKLTQNLEIYLMRFRFAGLFLTPTESIDVSVEVSR